jgi:Gamma-glutamyl cyclotransferase, AIG2-like
MTLMFLNGTAMAGQRDHGSHAGSTFLGPARTAAAYRFYAIRDEFPGLYPTAAGGRVIEGELYDIPDDTLRAKLLPAEPPELELGEVILIDGERVRGMLLMPSRLDPADRVVDIAELGGFRAYQRFLAWNSKARAVLSTDPVAAGGAAR